VPPEHGGPVTFQVEGRANGSSQLAPRVALTADLACELLQDLLFKVEVHREPRGFG
jgi:hypothetical protein